MDELGNGIVSGMKVGNGKGKLVGGGRGGANRKAANCAIEKQTRPGLVGWWGAEGTGN